MTAPAPRAEPLPPSPAEPEAAPASNPWPSELVALCAPMSTHTDIEPATQLQLLRAFIDTLKTPAELECVEESVQRIAPGLLDLRPLPKTPDAVRSWWRALGWNSFRVPLGTRFFTVLPELSEPSDDDLEKVRSLLCEKADVHCGGAAHAFLREAENSIDTLLQVQALSYHTEPRSPWSPPDADKISECEKQALQSDSPYIAWEGCVSDLVPNVVRVPESRFRLPSLGILTTHTFGYWNACEERVGWSLSNGLTILRASCRDLATKTWAARWRLARADKTTLREVALFTAVRPLLTHSPRYAYSFAIPPQFEKPQSFWGRSLGRTHVYDATETHYSLTGVTPAPVRGMVYTHTLVDPGGTFLADRLRVLEESLAPACATPQQRGEIRALLVALRGGDEDVDKELGELMQQVACPAPGSQPNPNATLYKASPVP